MRHAQGFKGLDSGFQVLPLARFSQFIPVNGFADVMDGRSEANQIIIELNTGKCELNSLNQFARSVVDEH
jgi:hypothetical protein